MVEHKCSKCLKVFDRKSSYDNHLNRKTSCVKSESAKFDKLKKVIDENNELKKTTEKILQENKELKEISKEILKEIESLKQSNKITNSKFISGDDKSKNLFITINQFGKENNDFIDVQKGKNILHKGYMAVPEFIRTLHFDENHPENHNMYISNARDNKVLVYDGENWNLELTNDVLQDLKDKGIDFIQARYSDLDKNIKKDKQAIDKIDRFLDSFNNDHEDKIKTLDKDIMLVLYNNKHIPKQTKANNSKLKNKCAL